MRVVYGIGFSLDLSGTLSNPSVLAGSDGHYSVVDAARDAVLHLVVELRNSNGSVLGVGRSQCNIILGRTVDHVSDGELLDSLILGALSAAVDTCNSVHMSSVASVLAVVPSL